MRTIGFLLLVVGGVLAYLGYNGKVGQAWQAIKTGNPVPINAAGGVGSVTGSYGPPIPSTSQASGGTPNNTFHTFINGGR